MMWLIVFSKTIIISDHATLIWKSKLFFLPQPFKQVRIQVKLKDLGYLKAPRQTIFSSFTTTYTPEV